MLAGEWLFSYADDSLSVVPIFVNAGAALLPAIAAGLATFFALLFKPKELVKACKEKPAIPIALVLFCGLVYGAIHFWPAGEDAKDGPRPGGRHGSGGTGGTNTIHIDWTRIALARIKARELGGVSTTQTSSGELEAPFIFRGGVRRRGSFGPAPEGPLKMAWDYYPVWTDDDGSVNVDTNAIIMASPAVVGNRVYGASCIIDPPSSYGGVFCVNATTGKTIWFTDLAADEEMRGIFSSPAITQDGKFLIVGQGLHPDIDCSLICIETATGKVHWTVKSKLHLESSPAIEDGVVYIGAGCIEDPETHKPISHRGYVMAVRIADGKELWRHDVADPESALAVQNGVVYTGSGFNGNAIVALRTGTDEELKKAGKKRLLWKTSSPYPVTGAVTLLKDMVVVGSGNGDYVYRDPDPAGIVIALDAKTGKTRWQVDTPDAVLGAIAADKLLICPVANGQVIALDPADGKQKWVSRVSGKSPVLAGAAVSGDSIFAVSSDGFMARMSVTDGRVLGKVYVNAKERPGEQGLSISAPIIANGRIYLGSETGGLRCYVGGKKK